MDDDEKLELLKRIAEKSFYKAVKSKTMWNKVLNNYIKPTIKKLHPRYNSNVKLEIVILKYNKIIGVKKINFLKHYSSA